MNLSLVYSFTIIRHIESLIANCRAFKNWKYSLRPIILEFSNISMTLRAQYFMKSQVNRKIIKIISRKKNIAR